MRRILLMSFAAVIGLGLAARAEVSIKGSTTVFPIAQKTAEVYMNNHSGKSVSVSGGGSGIGITALIDGTADIAASSRELKSEEAARAEGNIIEEKIARDAIAMVVHPSNSVSNLTRAQVRDIYGGKIKNWKELGGADIKIVLANRESTSGTFEALKKFLVDDMFEKFASRIYTAASSGAMTNFVAGSKGAIGYVGLGFLDSKVKALTINGVAPTMETAKEGGGYPYSRYLYMMRRIEVRPEVMDYVNFVKSKDGQAIVKELKFVPIY
ncbi:MAG: phosphate ABC transporter substrate-binding protein [Elusimicrobiota bacterium]|jgi:phosphate transport system substrate-binding protein|nr:phosphate ABC transporter substrate-binding protein [Elusimicrobiota bacterium]